MNRARTLAVVVPLAAALPLGHGAPPHPTPPRLVAHSVATLPLPVAQCTPDVPAYTTDVPVALEVLNAELAWRTATGAGVTVAVVDSGVAAGNAHLKDAVTGGISFVDLPGVDPSALTDVAAHGTAVAGQIAARPVDGSGVVGLAPDSTILPVRVYVSTDEQVVDAGNGPRDDRIAAGIRAAADAGAQVVNVSMSTTVDDPGLREAVASATSRGTLVVASAGNRNTTQDTDDSPRYPAAYPEVLSVTSVDADGLPTADAIHGQHVDIAAPGTDVLTTFLAAGDCVMASGVPSTSYATAYVSAAAALVAQAHPDESPAQWEHRLLATAGRSTLDARDDLVGWGVVRPTEALAFVDDGTAPGPVSPVHGQDPRPAPSASPLDLTQVEDPLDATRRTALWWALGGAGVTVAALLVGRLARRPHSTTRR
ncbi:S8 family serine peptidase [Sanguibacter suaedae]|uniref:S8 family serine peptidase n=1 Tax=Sanguibacter suaedae TaxID=2795737 RepID=A0A934I724_9MICO|nr:S8 family serine peptidase [Sanguibacter suaedae]MBI9114362.1 S8 family serine peptidase [Sanguibacter suaedae]